MEACRERSMPELRLWLASSETAITYLFPLWQNKHLRTIPYLSRRLLRESLTAERQINRVSYPVEL